MSSSILEIMNISKEFGIVKALSDVSFHINYGEVRALVGENGSGKSTLSSIVSGLQSASGGALRLYGKDYLPKSVMDAQKQGVVMLLQERGTIDGLSVAENIFIGQEDQFASITGVNRTAMNRAAKEALVKIGAEHIDPEELVDHYNFEDRKLVEVAKAMYLSPSLLIVDETTSALSHGGRQYIYKLMRHLKENQKSVIFISHDLDEVITVSDSVSVLKDGRYVDTIEKEEMTVDNIRRLMIGRELEGKYYRDDFEPNYSENVMLRLDHVCTNTLKNICFELHEGEILGLGGLSESGMHDIGKVIYDCGRTGNL